MKKIPFKLTDSDYIYIQNFKKEKRSAREMNRANILLLLHKGKWETDVADALNIDYKTVWRTKKKCIKFWAEKALIDAPRSWQPKKYTQTHETELVAMTCSSAPEWYARWTLELLTEEMRKKEGCASMNRETVRLMLKKTKQNLG